MNIESTDDPRYLRINGEEVRVFDPSPEFLAKFGPAGLAGVRMVTSFRQRGGKTRAAND